VTKTIASLSDHGWITDSGKILNHLLSYYILTDNGQSLLFQGNLINLPDTYFKHINDPEAMSAAIKTDMDKLLSRYFTSVDVETSVKPLTDSRHAILLYAAVIDSEGVKIELNRVVELNTSNLRNIIEVNNYGDGLAMLSGMN
jgi:hypothetical protein